MKRFLAGAWHYFPDPPGPTLKRPDAVDLPRRLPDRPEVQVPLATFNIERDVGEQHARP